MDYLPNDDILEFHSNTMDEVRKLYGLDQPGAMKEAVVILDTWIRTQKHFTKKDFSKEYLERIIISAKGSIERAKARLDKLLTLRTLMPKYFQDYNPRIDFESIKDILSYVVLPKLTRHHERVYLCKAMGKKFSAKMYLDGYRFCLLLSEYIRAHDYAQSYYIVIDYLDASVPELLAAADLMDLRQAVVTQVEGYGIRLKSVHIIVNSKFVDVVVSITKQVVSEKIGRRIYTHKTWDELYEHLPKEIFPKEFGGEVRSATELHDDWMKVLCTEDFREYWKMMTSARTDESLRDAVDFNDQYMGMPGTFRSLSVD